MQVKYTKPFITSKSGPGDDDIESGEYLYMYNDTEIMNDVDAYIDGPIEHVSKYRHLLQYMRKMKEYDKLTVWLSSPGGHLDTAMQIIESMNNAKGDIIVSVQGPASSAASLIALAAPQLVISDNAYMLCHAASYGTEGKQNDIESMVLFSQAQVKNIFRTVYKDFLTKEEIEEMMIGRDYWFNSSEIIRRLDIRQGIWQADAQRQAEVNQQVSNESIIKPKSSAKRKSIVQ